MFLIALLVPVLMIGFLFATTALEEFLFPHPAADDIAGPQVPESRTPATTVKGTEPASPEHPAA
ncbi:hypothetical protein AB0L10_25840 [Streptomyces flaveolus]|uniref:hypothetical protein n=1 Tax=Streptomyces flaveolus TaxID=67297 RepID=UPI00343FF801